MKTDHKELVYKAMDEMNKFSQHDRHTMITGDNNDKVHALCYTIFVTVQDEHTSLDDKMNCLRSAVDTAFLLGYDAGMERAK